jgi:hypothetical protein
LEDFSFCSNDMKDIEKRLKNVKDAPKTICLIRFGVDSLDELHSASGLEAMALQPKYAMYAEISPAVNIEPYCNAGRHHDTYVAPAAAEPDELKHQKGYGPHEKYDR